MAPRATKGSGRGAKPAPKVYDYSGLEKGMRLQAEAEGKWYAAEVVAVQSKKRPKAPVKVHFVGYEADWDSFVGGDQLRSKALKVKTEDTKTKDNKKDGKKADAKKDVKKKDPPMLRVACYKCKAGKAKEFEDIINNKVAKEFENAEGFIAIHYAFAQPELCTVVTLWRSGKDLANYKTGLRAKLTEMMASVLDKRVDAYEGPIEKSIRNRDTVLGDKAVLRLWGYQCKEGKEKDFTKALSSISGEFSKVDGVSWCGWCHSDPKTCVVAFVWESQEKLDAYRGGLKKTHMEQLGPLKEKTLFEYVGALNSVARKPRPRPILRVACYKCKAGKEAEFKTMIDDQVAKEFAELEGWITINYAFVDPNTVSITFLFRSQEALDSYKTNLRPKLTKMMEPLLDASGFSALEGPLERSFRNKDAKLDDNAVLRLWGYQCKEGKEEEFTKTLSAISGDFRKVKGVAWCGFAHSDPRTCVVAFVWESQAKLDAYREGLRKKHQEKMKPLKEKTIYEHVGPLKSVPQKPRYLPKTVQEAWDNHFSAFGEQNLDKIMLDYDEKSVTRVWNNVTGKKDEFVGVAAIRSCFAGLFKDLSDLKTLEAPVVDVDEEGRQVFLVWKCPGCNYETATDTFIYKQYRGAMKISRQNIVVTKK